MVVTAPTVHPLDQEPRIVGVDEVPPGLMAMDVDFGIGTSAESPPLRCRGLVVADASKKVVKVLEVRFGLSNTHRFLLLAVDPLPIPET